jgi:hypothetical protein
MRRSLPTPAPLALGLLPLSVLAAVLLASCTPVRMHLPSPLATAPEMAVAGRQGWSRLTGKPMTFGAFRAEEIHLGWRSTSRRRGPGGGLRIGTTEYSAGKERRSSRQRLEFRLVAEGSAPTWVRCLQAERGEALVFSKRDENGESTVRIGEHREVTFACTGEPESEELPAWGLVLATQDPRFVAGTLTLGETVLAVESSNVVATGVRIPVPIGFVVRRDDRPVAAVELFNRGAAWIDPQLPAAERTTLAGAAAALLLLDSSD